MDDIAGIWTQGTMLIPFPLDDMPITGIFIFVESYQVWNKDIFLSFEETLFI